MRGRGDRVNALEDELRSELAGERTRHDHAAGRDETVRLAERGFSRVSIEAPEVPVKTVAKVSSVGQVESLEDQLHFGALAEFDVLAEASVQLEEGLAAQAVEADLLARPRSQASLQLSRGLAGVGHQIIRIGCVNNDVRCAACSAPAEHVNALNRIIGARRGQLYDRRELQSPRQPNQTAADHTMALVIGRRAEIVLGKNVSEVRRAVAESRRGAIVGDRARDHVVGVEAEAIAQTTAVGEIQTVIARAPYRLLHVNSPQHRQTGGLKSRGQRAVAAERVELRVDVESLRLAQAQHVRVLDLDYRRG